MKSTKIVAMLSTMYKEATVFIIKCTVPDEQPRSHWDTAVRYRICPWCLARVPSSLSRCAECCTAFCSSGKYQRAAPQEEAPLEIPQEDIAQAMEAATATTSADPLPEPKDDVRTVAEPEMEVDSDIVMEEPEQEMEDVDETDQNEINERRPGSWSMTMPSSSNLNLLTQG